MPGVTGIADDMIIFGKTDQKHDGNLLNFLQVCRKNNLTFNPDKMQFRLPKVPFFGHSWSDRGLPVDTKKIEAVKRIELLQDVEMMRSFLALINFLNQFSPMLAELSDPLRKICRQKVEFQLTEACKVAFQHCKEEISRNITLPYFNPKAPTILQTDTSKKGLGAVLLQNSTLVMFASRALTGSEKNYQNLERECLATIWGIYFLYGKEFTLETDQKPLVSIYKKHMVEISPRIQRLVVRSFPYQPFHVRYSKGVEIPLADALSRVTPVSMDEDGINLPIIAVNQVTANIPCSSNDLDQICVETRKDLTLNLLIHYILNGWPCDQRQLPQELHPYWNFWEDLSVEDRIATKGSRLLMPSTLQRKALEQIHEGHQGVEKCMLKARESVFWPGISDEIWKTGKVWNLPVNFQSFQTSWKHQ